MEETRHDRTAACYRFELELQAYMEGENRPFALAHTRECAFCRVVFEDLEALRAAARELPLEEPSPAVWSNIRAQLATAGAFAEKASPWNWFWQLDFLRRPIPVAAFACMVTLGCLLTAPRNYPELEPASALTAPAGRTAVRSMAFIGDSDALERAVRELEDAFKAREGSLAPDVKATYENSLISLDASIRECSDSLQREPGNSLAHEYLLAAYSQKAEVLSSALEFDEGR
jgi:anti-sigma-K factor RskA